MPDPQPTVSVVICAFTDERWNDLKAAVEGVQRQSLPPCETIVVIDHNPELLEGARIQFPAARVMASRQARGVSGSRNSGAAVAKGDLIAFIDEDAVPRTDWLEQLTPGYSDTRVIGIGGAIEPLWYSDRPPWFPEEFDWVVGCTYRGLPTRTSQARNLIGCNMSFRREAFESLGGFRPEIGRLGSIPVGCEETELCIRARQRWPWRILVYEPRAKVYQRVPDRRGTWKYFTSRCYAEGISKALVARFVGRSDALSSERSYAFRTLPLGLARNLAGAVLETDPAGVLRAGAIVAGLAVTTAGFLRGNLRGTDRIRRQVEYEIEGS